ncbi:CHASE2 domain-containing protein [Lysobacter arvi]|uniref:diguanylate cyclase n=1 Tax=Lysobacter arvi TaxID=3038776 RepID=A0ABU1CAA8_9GAMM|nr:CHASE2 domain-containing protein [Lysobacter arvi]MDR0182055.1 CHASE2 domain-containing protein [Lysobacter arvi]
MTRLPFSASRRTLLTLVAGLLAAALAYGGALHRLDTALYDAHMADWTQEPDGRTLIVAIDERSIAELGQWPWPRSVHARLIDRLRESGARAVALDLLLAEPDRISRSNDLALADAMGRYGRVVLPVAPTAADAQGPTEELLPTPVIAAAAAGFGHTDLPGDEDGRTRALVVRAGLGDARWPSLPEALLTVGRETRALRVSTESSATPFDWVRAGHVRLRFSGPDGTYPRVSYSDVVNGRVPRELLRERWIIVGATAPGLAAPLLTPTYGSGSMAGVEFLANAFDTLRHGNMTRDASPAWHALAAFVIASTLAWLGLGGSMRRAVLLLVVPAVVAIAMSVAVLRFTHVWFGPMPLVLVLIATALLAVTAHLRHWRRQAHLDMLTALPNRRDFTASLDRELAACARDGEPLTLALIDVDHFKRFNDTAGHTRGDRLLVRVARLLESMLLRPRELAARLGGDEFALVLPETGATHARERVEDLRRRMTDLGPLFQSAGLRAPTLTIGIATSDPESPLTADALFDRADAALYLAKESGRNRVAAASELASGAWT